MNGDRFRRWSSGEKRGWVQLGLNLVGMAAIATAFLLRMQMQTALLTQSVENLSGAVRELRATIVSLNTASNDHEARLRVLEDRDDR